MVRKKEADQLQKENNISIDFRPTIISGAISEARQESNVDVNTNVEVNVQLSIQIPALQREFDDIKELLLQNNPDPAWEKQLNRLGDGLDDLSSQSDPNQLTGPLNKLFRVLEKLGDEKSTYGKVIKGAKHGVDMFRKLGKTYNRFAQWLALPQVPAALLK